VGYRGIMGGDNGIDIFPSPGGIAMKTLAIACLAAVLLITAVPPAPAQTSEDLIELLRHDLNTEATAIMSEALALDPNQAEIFWPIWREYRAEWAKTGDTQLTLLKDYAEHYQQMTDEKAEELAEQTFKLEKDRNDLRKKYWKKIDKELGSIIAARFVQMDRQLSNLIQLQISSQVPLVQAPH
jgi:hypothetical protein